MFGCRQRVLVCTYEEFRHRNTVFHTPRGLYELLVPPFGMVNSGATFQRLMNQTLEGSDSGKVMSTKFWTFRRHWTNILNTYVRFSNAYAIESSNYERINAECEFIGHHISAKGRRPLGSYINKVQGFHGQQW